MNDDKTNFILALTFVGVVAIVAIFGIFTVYSSGSTSSGVVFESQNVGDDNLVGQAIFGQNQGETRFINLGSFIDPVLILPFQTEVQLGGFTFEYLRPGIGFDGFVIRVNGEMHTFDQTHIRDGINLQNNLGERILLSNPHLINNVMHFSYFLNSDRIIPREMFRVRLQKGEDLSHQGLRFSLIDVTQDHIVLGVLSDRGEFQYKLDRFSRQAISDFHIVDSVMPNLRFERVDFYLESDFSHQLPSPRG